MGEMTSLQTQQSYCQAAVGNPVFLTYRLREYLAMGLSRTDLCRQGLRLSLWGLYSIFPPTPLYSKVKVKVKLLSHVQLFVTPWNVAHQAPPSMARIMEWVAISFCNYVLSYLFMYLTVILDKELLQADANT